MLFLHRATEMHKGVKHMSFANFEHALVILAQECSFDKDATMHDATLFEQFVAMMNYISSARMVNRHKQVCTKCDSHL